MRNQFPMLLALAALVLPTAPALAQQESATPSAERQAATPAHVAKHEDTEVYEPVPPVVTPGATCTAPPSDAIILFDGKNLDQWVSVKDHSPAMWPVANGILTVSKAPGSGNIETKRSFKNYQLHVEWRIPREHHRL